MSPSNGSGSGQDVFKGEEDLRLALQDLHQRIGAYREQFFQGLEAAVEAPLRSTFSEALEAHTRLCQEAGLAGAGEKIGADPEDPTNTDLAHRGRRFRRYREGVREEVLEPLQRSLQELELGREVGSRWVGFHDGFPGLADSLPASIVREEPGDLYEPSDGDRRLTLIRKGMVRVDRSIRDFLGAAGRGLVRLLLRRATPPPTRAQSVPLHSLAKERLLTLYPLSLGGVADALQEYYARPLDRLGTTLARWTEKWFDVEVAVHAAEGQPGARFRDEVLRTASARPNSRSEAPAEEPILPEPPDEGDTPPPPDIAELEEISRDLSDALRFGAVLPPPNELADRVGQALEEEWENLLEEVRVAGSFLASSPRRGINKSVQRSLDKARSQAEAWQGWQINILERISLTVLLLRLKEVFDQAEDTIQGRIVEEALEPLLKPWKRAMVGLHLLENQAGELFSGLRPGEVPTDLPNELDAIRAQALSLLESDIIEVLAQIKPSRVIHRVADEVSGKLSDALRFLPDAVRVAPLRRGTEPLTPNLAVRELPFREMVLNTLDVLRLESIRNSPAPLLSFLETATTECADLPNVVTYNLSMASEELRSPPDESPEQAISNARSVTTDGLTRTAHWVEGLLENLAVTWMEFVGEIRRLLQKSFQEIHVRAVAERAVEEQMLGLRAWARRWGRARTERMRVAADRARRQGRKYIRKGRVIGARLIHLGKSAVGVETGRDVETQRALDAIRQIPQLLDSLPLVYRRLFSLNPIMDPNLLIGRESELAWVSARLKDWMTGHGRPCILTGPVGVGHTSFLNVAEAMILEEIQTHRIDLNTRIRADDPLASLLAERLELEGKGPWTLAGLARHLQDLAPPVTPFAVILEHLEHLFMRISGGTDLLESFISFQALTSKQVFWMSTMSDSTWKLLEKNEPRAAGLIAHLPFSTLSRGATEEMILVRHRLSGLPLEFVQPDDLNPLVRRRLGLSRGEKARQDVIRAEFFDRLFRMAEDNIAVAILLWLRSADFSSRKGWLRVSPPPRLRSYFIDDLDLSLGFALKAFLDHGSLTMEEHRAVFDAPAEESFQVFETLRNLSLIEPSGAKGARSSSSAPTTEGERYRIPPLMGQMLANHLKSRNILH
ncbi:MAG: hypothetical protein ACWGSQ_08780 [Longimicrobiales bacterium]